MNPLSTIFKTFRFEAAHKLPNVPEGHKCGRLHGHSFRVEVHICGPVLEPECWVVDFAELKKIWRTQIDAVLDHNYLNDVAGLENPTSEVLARWIWSRLSQPIRQIDAKNRHGSGISLKSIVVQETCSSGAIFEGKAE